LTTTNKKETDMMTNYNNQLFYNMKHQIVNSKASEAKKERALEFLMAAAEPGRDDVLGALSLIPRVLERDYVPLLGSSVKHRLVRALLENADVEEGRARLLDDVLGMADVDAEDILRIHGWVRALPGDMGPLDFFDACVMALIGMKPAVLREKEDAE
jgi:hypothetical protein